MINYFQKQYNYYFYGVLDLTGKKEISSFYYCKNKHIKKIIIGNTIENCGRFSFGFCNNLKEIDFSNSIIKKISYACFCDLNYLKTIYLPENIELLEKYSFSSCKSLKSIHLENVKIIENSAFSGCINLESIFLNGIEKIGNYSFLFCMKLNRIVISDSIQEINNDAFYEHYNEIEITCPDQFYDFFLRKFPNAKINHNDYLIK